MQQCRFFIGLVLLVAATYTEALKCMTCKGSSFEDCDVRGHVTQCQQNQQSCETAIRRYHDKLTVEKRCKNEKACQDNQMQDNQRSGKSTQCNVDQANSFCTCCCDTDLCNGGIPSCYKAAMPLPTANECPGLEREFPHGKMNCYGREGQNQICQYECTDENYFIHPKGRDTNVCMGNSTWSIERPCCARSCPPHLLYDSVAIFSYKSETVGREQSLHWIEDFPKYEIFAWDGVQEGAMYFSGQPQLNTVINFADSNYDVNKMIQLAHERMMPVNEGPVNLGAAIRYAVNNMFTKEAGARDSRVPKLIQIGIDKNPDDPVDAIAAGKEARDRGFFFYLFAFNGKSENFNATLFSEIVGGEEEHYYIYDDHYSNLTLTHFADVIYHFCSNPCVHVLHDH